MQSRGFGSWVILGALLLLLVASFAFILDMRFSPGDIYPRYSTKRSDPLGSRALYESLERLPSIRVSQNVTSLQRISGLDKDTALMLLGLPRTLLEKLRATDDSPVLKAVKRGTRLVIVMNPEFVPANLQMEEDLDNWFERREKIKKKAEEAGEEENERSRKGESESVEESAKEDGKEESTEKNAGSKDLDKKNKENEEIEEKGKKDGADDNKVKGQGTSVEDEGEYEEEDGEPFLEHVAINLFVPDEFERPEEGWPVEAVTDTRQKEKNDAEVGEAGKPGPPEVYPNWHSQFRFDQLGKEWQQLALVEGKPVVVERTYGEGSIVMISDAYFSSNEALWRGGDTSLLWWMVGGKKHVVFDETIHGNVEHGGMMKLIRQYRLHGFFLGLFIFIALFAWASASSLVPGSVDLERGLVSPEGAVVGEDASTGLVRLLRRSVNSGELLERCMDIWSRNEGRARDMAASLTPSQKKELDELLATRKSRPKQLSLCDGYGKIVQVLSRKN